MADVRAGQVSATATAAPSGVATGLARGTIERLATGMAKVRCGTAAFIFIPLFEWRRLSHPLLAVAAALAASVESGWFYRRVRRTGTLQDFTLLWGDVLFCVALSAVASRVVPPSGRNVLLTEVVPFSLASAGIVGFGWGLRPKAMAAVAVLSATWAAAVWPNVTLKLASDALGFMVWYAVTVVVGRELRSVAAAADASQEAIREAQAETAERRREADVNRERDITHREIHEHLLPIVDAVASARPVTDALVRTANREADRARRLLLDGRVTLRPGFEALLSDARDTYVDAGLQIIAAFRVVTDPPDDVGEAIAGAAREALCNVVKYAQTRQDIHLYVEATDAGVEVVVRDHGVGFDPAATRPGGGFARTYEAVRRHGGEVTVTSRPGGGTRVAFYWSAGT